MFLLAAVLLVLIGFAHSYLGERYLLMRLFRRDDLPKLLGSDVFTKNTLRFAWHVTTVAWFGFAALLFKMSTGAISIEFIANVMAVTFLIHGLIALFGSKGRHLSWIVFLAIALATLYAAHGI